MRKADENQDKTYFREQGMKPRKVGEIVADAIDNERFYVFTQCEFAPLIKKRFDCIVTGTDPEFPGPLPETLDKLGALIEAGET